MKKFKKLFFYIILFITFINVTVKAETVNKVEVFGNDRISLETIKIFGDINIGKNYETSDVSQIIKKLYETNFFSNISVKLQNNVLQITVAENPMINLVIFNGEKAKKYKEALSEMLNLAEKTSFIKSFVKSDVNIIKEFYRSLGFYFIKIDVQIEKLEKNRVNLIYTFEKGEKAKIAKIYFLGDKKVRDMTLRDVITSQESKFWKFISKNIYLNKGRVELDKRLLINYYKNIGYYEVDITSSNVEYSEGEGFVLTYSINAGKRYKFKKIYASVADELDKAAFSSLQEDFDEVIGEYYSQSKVTKILEKVDKLSEQKELQFVNHRLVETLDGDGVEININIFEGKKFTIERVNIVGNSITNDEVIRGELVVDEGDPYSALLINKSINNLKARRIFANVEENIMEGSLPDLKVLEITVQEKATGEISAGAGIGTDGTSFMFAVKENNWLGKGVSVQTKFNISPETLRGSIGFRDPNYKFSDNAVFGTFSLQSADFLETSGYESSKTGLSLGTSFEQYEDLYFAPSLSITHEEIDAKGSSSASIKNMTGTFTNVDFMYGVTSDKRNQSFQPTDGYVAKFVQSLPLYLDSSSIMNGLEFSKYYSFSDDVVGVTRFYARTMHGVDEDVRLSNRLRLPSNRLRGFKSNKFGPKDGTDYVGGNYAAALGIEAQLPNLLPEATKTDISIFLDTANLWGVDYDSTVAGSSSIRASAGISANVFTAIGPLTFTLAQALSKASSDQTETFNFRLGTSF